MKDSRLRVWIRLGLLFAGCLLVASGFLIRVKVHDPKEAEFDLSEFGIEGLEPYRQLLDKDLLRNATFSGVIRKDGKLYTTEGGTSAGGKPTCPT